MAILMIAGAFGSKLYAQRDVTSQYITNATLSDGTNGWTKTFTKNKETNDPKDAFSESTRGNNTTGYATEAYAGWGDLIQTDYSMKQSITLPAGHYTLVNYSFFRQGDANDEEHNKTSKAYLIAGENKVLLKTLRDINAPSYANSQAEGANVFDSKMYRNTIDFTIDTDNTTIEIGVDGVFDEMRSWCIVGQFELINNDLPASMEAPFDVTGLITNPGFEYRDMTGWELSENGAISTQNNDQSFKVGGYYAEKWQASGALSARSMSQTITELPVGFYKLTANLGGDGTYIKLNNKIVNWTADKDYTVGYVLREGEDLTITAGKTAEGTANWIHFDNFKLQFCGDVAAALTTLCGNVSKYEEKLSTAAYNKLVEDVANQNKTYTDVDELLAAISAVNALYEEADALAEAYSTAKEYTYTSKYYDAVSNLANVAYKENTEGAHAALQTAIANCEFVALDQTVLDSKTTAEDVNAYISSLNAQNVSQDNDLKTAGITYAGNAEPTGDNKFDLTFMLTNANLEGLPIWAKCDGWFTDQPDGNSQVMTNERVKSDDGREAFFEYWSGTAKANDQFTLYQKVTLPNGTYNMTCLAFAHPDNTEGEVSKVKFFANDTEGSTITSKNLAPANIEFVQNDESGSGEVKIGLKACEGNEYRWMGIGYVELYKLAPKACELKDADTEAPTPGAYSSVTYNRSLLEGLNTIVLPFQTTKEELGAETVLEYTGTTTNSDNKIVLNFKEVETLSPNVPYAILMTAEAALPVFENKTLIAPTDLTVTDVNGNYNFIGTYTCWTKDVDSPIANGDYVAGAEEFKKAKGGNGLKAYRAYLKKIGEAEPINVAFNFNGEIVNGIEAVEILNRMSGDIYNINGQKVSHTQKGVYIMNGKKVVVK